MVGWTQPMRDEVRPTLRTQGDDVRASRSVASGFNAEAAAVAARAAAQRDCSRADSSVSGIRPVR